MMPPTLSPRQRQVARLAEHLSYQGIAERLNISYTTVVEHARQIAQRIGQAGEAPTAVMARWRSES